MEINKLSLDQKEKFKNNVKTGSINFYDDISKNRSIFKYASKYAYFNNLNDKTSRLKKN